MFVPATDNNDLEKINHTLGRITAGLDSRLVPMVSQIVRIIRDISGKVDQMSVNDLADCIKAEPSTMERIIAIAGSVGYNSSGAEVKSIHHAISLIGFEQVRSLAVSILLFESAQSKYAAETNRQLAGSALIGGLVAAEMSKRVLSANSELAFICGALRGYGRMLAATFMPQEYAAAVEIGIRDGADSAFRQVFGLTALELGRRVLENMQLPKMILDTFTVVPPSLRKKTASDSALTLVAAAEFGAHVAELLLMPSLTSYNYESRMEMLSRDYDPVFYLTPAASRDLLHHVVAVLDSFRSHTGSYVGSIAVFRRLESLALDRRLSPLGPVVVARPEPPLEIVVKPKKPIPPVVIVNFEI